MHSLWTLLVGLVLVALAAVIWVVAFRSSPATRPSKPIEIETIRVGPGTFMMGDPADANIASDEHAHQVTLTKPYLIGEYPVTVAQFSQFVSETGYRTTAETHGFAMVHADKPENFRGQKGLNWRTAFPSLPDSVPVVCVSWDDARAFCKWAEQKTHRKTRLPTEAEWEFACRAGNDSRFNVDGPPDSFGWQPNRWGLYDMHGNVWEWCYDAVAPYPKQAAVDPSGPDRPSAKYRVARGGDWWDPPSIGTSFNRSWWSPIHGYYHIGFRVVQEP